MKWLIIKKYAIDETIAIAKEIDLSKETVDILLVDINHYLENANGVQASQSWLDFKKYLEEKYYENWIKKQWIINI